MRILERGYGIEQAEALVEAYFLDYARDFDGEDFDYLWFPLLHEEGEVWHAQALLGSNFVRKNHPQFWREALTLEEFEQAVLPEEWIAFLDELE